MKIQGLHHFAWKCVNADETIAFYEGILDLPYVHKIEKDHVPSTGKYAPYKHIFFRMPDQSHIAFFDLGDGIGTTTNCDNWIVHFAFEVECFDEKDTVRKHRDNTLSSYKKDPWGNVYELIKYPEET